MSDDKKTTKPLVCEPHSHLVGIFKFVKDIQFRDLLIKYSNLFALTICPLY